MIRTIAPQLQAPQLAARALGRSQISMRRAATTHAAPLLVTHLSVRRTWQDALDVSPLAAAFENAAARALHSGNGELVEVRLPQGHKNLRYELDSLMEHIRETAKEDLGLHMSWESASADPAATIRHAIIAPKR